MHTTWAVICVAVALSVNFICVIPSRILLEEISSKLSVSTYICATSVDVGTIENLVL